MTAALEVLGLVVRGRGRTVVDDVSFSIEPGERLALVGESGSGKSMTALALLGLLPAGFRISRGEIRLAGRAVDPRSAAMASIRGRQVGVVFQDPMTALNPVLTIGYQVVEAIRIHRRLAPAAARHEAIALLERVRIARAAERLDDYPHQLSGGMRQRVMIAMAIAHRPALLVADEPTTALDVTTQRQILGLMDDLCRSSGTGLLLITHDLGVVEGFCDRAVVLYAGQTMEVAPVRDLMRAPRHPYTAGLLRSVPPVDRDIDWLVPIPGDPATAGDAPGCPFVGRCPQAYAPCEAERPGLRRAAPTGSVAACHLVPA